MKTHILSLVALIASSLVTEAQVVVQQQTTYSTTPGLNVQFNAWNPLQSAPQYYSVWDAYTNQYIMVPVTQQQPVVYVDQFGNPIQQQQVTYYTDQFGNPVQQQTTTTSSCNTYTPPATVYVDQFGNPIHPQQPVVYTDPYSNPVRPTVIPANPHFTNNTCAPVTSAYPMNQADFTNGLNYIHNQNFESTRLTVAKQMLSGNWVTSDQVRQMMLQMNFEDSRIEIARFAYNRVVDPQNYFVVNNGFTFSSSVDQLNSYLFGR